MQMLPHFFSLAPGNYSMTMNDSSNRSHLGAKSRKFQAKIRSHTRLYFTVALIKNTECTDCPSDQLKPKPIMEQTIWVRGHLLGRLKGTDSREARRRKGTSFYDVRTEGGGVATKADIQ